MRADEVQPHFFDLFIPSRLTLLCESGLGVKIGSEGDKEAQRLVRGMQQGIAFKVEMATGGEQRCQHGLHIVDRDVRLDRIGKVGSKPDALQYWHRSLKSRGHITLAGHIQCFVYGHLASARGHLTLESLKNYWRSWHLELLA